MDSLQHLAPLLWPVHHQRKLLTVGLKIACDLHGNISFFFSKMAKVDKKIKSKTFSEILKQQ